MVKIFNFFYKTLSFFVIIIYIQVKHIYKILIPVMALLALSSVSSAYTIDDYENYVIGGINTPQETSVVSIGTVHYSETDFYDIPATIYYGE